MEVSRTRCRRVQKRSKPNRSGKYPKSVSIGAASRRWSADLTYGFIAGSSAYVLAGADYHRNILRIKAFSGSRDDENGQRSCSDEKELEMTRSNRTKNRIYYRFLM